MQIILREFSALNAYPQICKPYTEVKSPYLKSQDTEGEDQEGIYGVIEDNGPEIKKTETKMYTTKTKTGIQELTYVYNADPKIIEVSCNLIIVLFMFRNLKSNTAMQRKLKEMMKILWVLIKGLYLLLKNR